MPSTVGYRTELLRNDWQPPRPCSLYVRARPEVFAHAVPCKPNLVSILHYFSVVRANNSVGPGGQRAPDLPSPRGQKGAAGEQESQPPRKLGPSSGLACHIDTCHRPLGPGEGGYGDCVSAPVIREGGKQSFPLYLSRVESSRSALAWHIHLLSLPREMVEKGRLIYLVTCVPTSAREKKRGKRKN